MKVFITCKILSVETVLSMHVCARTHACTHARAHTHRGTPTYKHSDCAKLILHSLKQAATRGLRSVKTTVQNEQWMDRV